MNFNNSGSSPPPPPKKNNSKTIVGIIIAVALAVIGSVVIMQVVMKAQDNMDRVFSPGSSLSYQPTTAEISEKCTEKVRQLLQSEPTQYMIDVCVRTFNNEMNSPNHLSANPTTSEITDKCTEAISREYGSAPKLSVNICVGTVLGELNK